MAVPVMAALSAASAVAETVEKLSPAATRKIKDTAQQFESVFLTNMFEEMFSGIQEQDGPLGAGPGQSAWRCSARMAACPTRSRRTTRLKRCGRCWPPRA